jgi:hypothetical protein
MPKSSSRKKLSMDAITIPDEAVENFVAFLKVKLEPKDFAELKDMLGQSKHSEDEDDDDEPDAAIDSPPAFKGQPKTGGGMAADSQGRSYDDRWPNAARIKVWL